MRLIPKWAPLQWVGAALMFVGCVATGFFLSPKEDSIPSVPINQLGLHPDHSEKAAIVAASMPKFRLVGDAAGEDNSRKVVKLWDAVLQVRGDHLPNIPQEVGDCVSFGAAHAMDYLQFVQMVRGPPAEAIEYHPAYPPWIYGASRVWVGKKHGSHFSGDGSVGAYAAEALNTYGCLRSDHEKVPPYSGQVARTWGASGPPAWAKDVAKAYLVQTVAPVNTAAEARDAICNGFPVTIASGWWGTTSIPIVDGRRVATRNASWRHQQCLIGYDGSGREPLFYCLNSWGPNAHPAPLQGEPPGGYWIRFRDVEHICGEGDSWALSAFEGFPANAINWDDLTRRPVTSSGPPINGFQGGGQMFTIDAGFVGGIAIAMLGFVLFQMARRIRPKMIAPIVAIAAFAIGSGGYAQDFAGASKREAVPVQADPMGDALNVVADPMGWGVASTRPTVSVESLPWGQAHSREVKQQPEQGELSPSPDVRKAGPKPQALVFVRPVGCSACMQEKAHLRKYVEPAGWTVAEDPGADFRIVDVLKEPKLAEKYAVHVVPTTVYLSKTGEIAERREGFSTERNWTSRLKSLSNQ